MNYIISSYPILCKNVWFSLYCSFSYPRSQTTSKMVCLDRQVSNYAQTISQLFQVSLIKDMQYMLIRSK